ncbi:fas-activated serine/threonine kinase [Geospiza fortis]|uniref:Fas-activated serine/threonine kinase n=1 Tax=Geospiza fortis TaxID=48883 RepID=A0A8N5F0H6_GEOFO|nr:fas-activated serine/threonine kinase [Geospiza fortis]
MPSATSGHPVGFGDSWDLCHSRHLEGPRDPLLGTYFPGQEQQVRLIYQGQLLRDDTQSLAGLHLGHLSVLHCHLSPPSAAPTGPPAGSGDGCGPAGQVLEQPEFHVLCQAIVSGCAKFDNFSIVNCLYAAAALGLPGESPLVRVLEDESRSRLGRFNQKDVSMVFSSVMRLHPSSPHPLVESCLSSLERHLEKERHPQTLFLLLSYYRLRAQALQGHAASDQQLINNRKILRLVRHTLGQVSAMREHELALLDEMLALCAQEANNKALEAIFSSQLFYENRQERFIRSMAGEGRPGGSSIAPSLGVQGSGGPDLSLVPAQPHTPLLPQVIQKLVFPFSRMNYRPSNHSELFPKLEAILEQKAGSSPLATVNILMSMFQLSHFPQTVLHQVFSPGFITNVMSSPYALIVRRYLSLLDAAVELEFREYSGPRLDPRYRVLMFEHALTADEANRKYSYKGLVAEALRQLVGEECYRQDEVLPPGYCTDFLLWINRSGTVLPLSRVPAASRAPPATSPTQSPLCWVLQCPCHQQGPAGCCSSAATVLGSRVCGWGGTVAWGDTPCCLLCRVVLSVNDKWHYCQNSDILVGSRAMRDRHLRLLGYCLVQLPYTELEKVSGIEEAKHYLRQKLRELRF